MDSSFKHLKLLETQGTLELVATANLEAQEERVAIIMLHMTVEAPKDQLVIRDPPGT
jgi:hypothetical protein